MSKNREKGCRARQYSDQMQCDACGLSWDMNDDDPPECVPVDPKDRGRRTLRQLIKDTSK